MNDAGRSDEPVSGIDAIDRPLPFTLLKVKSELNERLALAACAALQQSRFGLSRAAACLADALMPLPSGERDSSECFASHGACRCAAVC